MNDRESQSIQADSRNIVNSWHEWTIEDGQRRIVLCVETALELRPGSEGFDPARLETLTEEAAQLMRTSASPIDAVRIIPARWTL